MLPDLEDMFLLNSIHITHAGSIITIDNADAASLNQSCYLYLHCNYSTSNCIGGRIRALNELSYNDSILLQISVPGVPDIFSDENVINGTLLVKIYGLVRFSHVNYV